MLGVLALLLVAAVVFGRLGAWQLDRATERGEQAAQRAADRAAVAGPRPLDDVVRPQEAFTADDVGVEVRVRGAYVPGAQQYLVAEAHDGGADGWLVLAAFEVGEGEGAGAILPVARGWVADPDGVAQALVAGGDLTVPGGEVEVVGYLAASEASLAVLPEGSGPGVLGSVSSAQLANLWGSPIYAGYLRLASSDPSEVPALTPASAPEPPRAGLNLQNVAYAAQWWIFGGFALLLWVRLVRDEAARLVPRS